MPWCPKCKSEYREGFTVCADCGSELVSEEQLWEMEEKRLAAEAARALRGSAIGAMETGEPGEEEMGFVLPEPEEIVERLKEAEASRAVPGGLLYQDSSERASENRSSAWVLLVMGNTGLLVIILGITGVIPLEFSNPYLFYGVMAAVFILFVVAGVVSMKNAVFFEERAESENSLRDTLLKWCRENLRAQSLDEEIGMDGSESAEARYFKRFECIRAKLNYQFLNLDQAFLEKFIDDQVYDMVYDREEELT